MKQFTIIFLLLFLSCDKENSNDCLQASGEIIQKEIIVENFDKILVNKRVELIISEGPQKVIIETGENLISDVLVEVIDGELILSNYNSCNFFREYNLTKIHVTSPNLTTIRNASEHKVSSKGIITYPSIYLRSSGEKRERLAVGDWHLNINNSKVRIWGNGISNFYLTGKTDNLNISFSDGDTRFEGQTFEAKHISVRQVSSNDILINPLESLTGSIHSVGDVISFNKPLIVDVDVQSDGKLIFK